MSSRIDEINVELEGLRHAIRQRRRQERSASCQWTFSGDLKRAVLAAREISGGHAESIVPFVKSSAACRHWPPKPNAEIHDIISQVWAAATVSEIAEAMNHADDDNRVSLKTAHYEVSQWRVALWCQRMNTERGCAVWTDTVLEALREIFLSVPSIVRPVLPDNASACRKWAQRWRRRWGARYGMLQKRVHEPMEVSCQKALS